jgi:hypothetical protein
VLFLYYEPFIYPDGTSNIPSDTLEEEDFDCPFPDDDIEDFEKGVVINFIASFSVFVIV